MTPFIIGVYLGFLKASFMVLLSPDTCPELIALQDNAEPDNPGFVNHKGGDHLHPSQPQLVAERPEINLI
jgi:hypothetical protein